MSAHPAANPGAEADRPGAPLVVSRFEAMLLRMVRGFYRADPDNPVASGKAPVPAGKLPNPNGLSPACLHLVRDTLAKGCVEYLARAGGWRPERFLRLGKPVAGRLWERTPVPELGLSFSRHAIDFLVWLAAGRPDTGFDWNPPTAELTAGDKFLMFLAYDGLRETEARQAFVGRPLFAIHGLIRLYFPEDFASTTSPQRLDFAGWTEGVGASIIEALQPRLQRRWLEIERAKSQIGDWNRLRGVGVSQELALDGFLQACEAARRPDLARFFLKAMSELLLRDLTPAFWIAGLQQASAPPRLADRIHAQRYGLAVLRQVEAVNAWTHRARATGFLDDGYAVAQLWLTDWEEHRGDEIATIAQQLLRQIEPLRVHAPGAASNRAEQPTAGTVSG